MRGTENSAGIRAGPGRGRGPGSGNHAFVVRPDSTAPAVGSAVVLWLHWLGHNRNDYTQFLAEAVALAGRGVVSCFKKGPSRGSDPE